MSETQKALRIIIAGGRDFVDYDMLKRQTLKAIREINLETNNKPKTTKDKITIISGCAKGADTLAIQFANEFRLPLKRMPADWDKYGKRAGYMRNHDMAQFAIQDSNAQGALIAFWDEKSKGTEHMINTAKKLGLIVIVEKY